MIIRSKTFKDWMLANLKDYIKDIATHGADAGYPMITYYHDTCKLYAKFKEEIWSMAVQDAEDLGHKNVFEMIASFRIAGNVQSVDEFENLMVWYAAEKIANELYEG